MHTQIQSKKCGNLQCSNILKDTLNKIPITEFCRSKATSSGYQSWCKLCCKAKRLIYQQTLKYKQTRSNRYNYRYSNDPAYKEKLKLRARTRNNKPQTKNKTLLIKYGITLEQKKELLIRQNYSCAICLIKINIDFRGTVRDWCTDHDHKTNKVRGLLCDKCNRGLGQFLDSKELLQKAINYLKQNENQI